MTQQQNRNIAIQSATRAHFQCKHCSNSSVWREGGHAVAQKHLATQHQLRNSGDYTIGQRKPQVYIAKARYFNSYDDSKAAEDDE